MKKIILPLLCLAISACIKAQNVSTLYDFGTEETTDNIIIDSAGDMSGYDYNGHSIYKVTPRGEVSIFTYGITAPNSLAFDSEGALFVCDNIDDAIYKLDDSGSIVETYDVDSPSASGCG